jgi:hypothetical protein
VADLHRIHLRTEARDHTTLLELREARLHRAARHAEPPRDLEKAQPGVLAQLGDQARVQPIDGGSLARQSDQNLA